MYSYSFLNIILQAFYEMQRLLPASARMYRFDGDEFAIVYEQATRKQVRELYKIIHAYCNRRHFIDDIGYFCTVSGGIAMFWEDGDNFLDLIKYADNALEASKYRGKNQCTQFSHELVQIKRRRLSIANQLQQCFAGYAGFLPRISAPDQCFQYEGGGGRGFAALVQQ